MVSGRLGIARQKCMAGEAYDSGHRSVGKSRFIVIVREPLAQKLDRLQKMRPRPQVDKGEVLGHYCVEVVLRSENHGMKVGRIQC